MVKVVFKGAKIQTGDRIKIPKAIVDTLGLSSGENIVLYFDAENREIVIKEDKKLVEKKQKSKKKKK